MVMWESGPNGQITSQWAWWHWPHSRYGFDQTWARRWTLAPSMFARRRGSSLSAATKCGEIMAGVRGEGNVPLSARTPGYSPAYHYPLKDRTNFTNRANHNWESVRSLRPPSIFESNQINNSCWIFVPGHIDVQGSYYFNATSQHRKLNQEANSSRHQLSQT